MSSLKPLVKFLGKYWPAAATAAAALWVAMRAGNPLNPVAPVGMRKCSCGVLAGTVVVAVFGVRPSTSMRFVSFAVSCVELRNGRAEGAFEGCGGQLSPPPPPPLPISPSPSPLPLSLLSSFSITTRAELCWQRKKLIMYE
uniref:Uncharacterized protein n=1 Tax=Glossina pallidipes TaxID=7398 RepID=A0A1B0AK29_GLOPL